MDSTYPSTTQPGWDDTVSSHQSMPHVTPYHHSTRPLHRQEHQSAQRANDWPQRLTSANGVPVEDLRRDRSYEYSPSVQHNPRNEDAFRRQWPHQPPSHNGFAPRQPPPRHAYRDPPRAARRPQMHNSTRMMVHPSQRGMRRDMPPQSTRSQPRGPYQPGPPPHQSYSDLQPGTSIDAPNRPPLGPPPSSRRGPTTYYPKFEEVHRISEETASMKDEQHGGIDLPHMQPPLPETTTAVDLDEANRSQPTIVVTKNESIPVASGFNASHDSAASTSLGGPIPRVIGDRPDSDNQDERLATTQNQDLQNQNPVSTHEFAAEGQSSIPHCRNHTTCADSDTSSVKSDDGLDEKDLEALSSRPAGLSTANRKNKPLRIDVGAVRDAEARGSLTSLSDLILRATKVASNLDRGKTASRLGLDWFLNAERDEKRKSGNNSLHDMLDSFPPPANLATDPRPSPDRLSSDLRQSILAIEPETDLPESQPPKTPRRRCGMPIWAFALTVILLGLLITAAVIVPIILLVVIPNQQHNNSNNSANTSNTVTFNPALANCEKELTCENSGTITLGANNTCQCLCINGFSGPTCAESSQIGCTKIPLANGTITTNATIGSEIPAIVETSQTNFSLALNTTTLLTIFAQQELSCTAQNALVTLNNIASSSSTTQPRDTPSPSTHNSQIVPFAQTVILYILQSTTQLPSAVAAQVEFQAYLARNTTSRGDAIRDPRNFFLTDGYAADLVHLKLWTRNGTAVGS